MAGNRAQQRTKVQPSRRPAQRRPIIEVPLEDFNESNNILIHSWPGQGKTVFGAGAPNSTLVSAEPGSISAKRQGSKAGLVKIRNWQTALDFLAAVENGDFSHRDWLIIDTLSTLQRKDMRDVVDRAVAANPAKFDPDVPAVQHYLKTQNSFVRWVERMVDAPINCLFLAHTMRVDDLEGDTLYLPSIQGGADKGYPIANYVCGLMNAVGYMEMRQARKGKPDMVRRILWQPTEQDGIKYIAKDQYDAFGRITDDWTMTDLIAAIEGSGSEEQERPARKRRAR